MKSGCLLKENRVFGQESDSEAVGFDFCVLLVVELVVEALMVVCPAENVGCLELTVSHVEYFYRFFVESQNFEAVAVERNHADL